MVWCSMQSQHCKSLWCKELQQSVAPLSLPAVVVAGLTPFTVTFDFIATMPVFACNPRNVFNLLFAYRDGLWVWPLSRKHNSQCLADPVAHCRRRMKFSKLVLHMGTLLMRVPRGALASSSLGTVCLHGLALLQTCCHGLKASWYTC